MRLLLNFLIKHNHWFLFLLLEGIGVMLIVQFNKYQNAVVFTSANRVAGTVFESLADVGDYFSLRDDNEQLLEYNRLLNERVVTLEKELSHYRDSADVVSLRQTGGREFFYKTATVVNNSLNSVNNFLTIDRGTCDSVFTEMGVLNHQGVVGIVYTVSQHFAIVIPLLNSKSSISCRIKNSDSFCTLQWDGKDIQHSYLVDLPRYTVIEQGDTVLTSGFSSIFPGGIPVGTIERVEESSDGMFSRARVKLFVDFASVDKLFLVGNRAAAEQKKLEESLKKK